MCLVLLWFSAHPQLELMLAGNRDEYLSRRSAPPAVMATDPLVYAGRDLEAGGTWMGRNERGLLATITNRHGSHHQPPANARSRGEIAAHILGYRELAAAVAYAADLDLARYRAFNLLFGTTAGFYFLSSTEGGPPRPIAPGFHALSNSTLDDRTWPKVDQAHRFAESQRAASAAALLLALQHFLADTTPPSLLTPSPLDDSPRGALGAVFVQAGGYGTVSSSIISIGSSCGDRYYFSEGADLRAWQSGKGPNPYRLIDFGA